MFVTTLFLAVFTMGLPSAPTVTTTSPDAEEIVRIHQTPATIEHVEDARMVLAMHNAARAAHGLPALAFDPQLCEIARQHARDMVARSYFAHTDPDGLTPFARMSRSRYRFTFAGENIALDENAEAAGRDLLTSAGHLANILEKHFSRIGIAAFSSTDGEVFVEDFSD